MHVSLILFCSYVERLCFDNGKSLFIRRHSRSFSSVCCVMVWRTIVELYLLCNRLLVDGILRDTRAKNYDFVLTLSFPTLIVVNSGAEFKEKKRFRSIYHFANEKVFPPFSFPFALVTLYFIYWFYSIYLNYHLQNFSSETNRRK